MINPAFNFGSKLALDAYGVTGANTAQGSPPLSHDRMPNQIDPHATPPKPAHQVTPPGNPILGNKLAGDQEARVQAALDTINRGMVHNDAGSAEMHHESGLTSLEDLEEQANTAEPWALPEMAETSYKRRADYVPPTTREKLMQWLKGHGYPEATDPQTWAQQLAAFQASGPEASKLAGEGLGSAHPYPGPSYTGAEHSTPVSGARRFLGDVKKQKAGLGGEDEAFTAKRGMDQGAYLLDPKVSGPGFKGTTSRTKATPGLLTSAKAAPSPTAPALPKIPEAPTTAEKVAMSVLLYEMMKTAGVLWKDLPEPRIMATREAGGDTLYPLTMRTQEPRRLVKPFSDSTSNMQWAAGALTDYVDNPETDLNDPEEDTRHQLVHGLLQRRWPARYRSMTPEDIQRLLESTVDEEPAEEGGAVKAADVGDDWGLRYRPDPETVGKDMLQGGLMGGLGVPAAVGALGGGLYGALNPGEDENGEEESLLLAALKKGLIGGGIGAGLGGLGMAGGVGGATLGAMKSMPHGDTKFATDYPISSVLHSNNANPGGGLTGGAASPGHGGGAEVTAGSSNQSEAPTTGGTAGPKPPTQYAASMSGPGIAHSTIH